MNCGEEIGGEGRKWLLKRVSGQAQAGFCGSGSGTLLPFFLISARAWGDEVCLPPSAGPLHLEQESVTAQPANWCRGDAALRAACPHPDRLRFLFNLSTHTHTYTCSASQLHLALLANLTLPPPSLSRGGSGYYRCVLCVFRRAIKRWSGVRDVERVLCGGEESAGHAPQTPSVSLLDHTLMRHLCESRPSVRLSDAGSDWKTTTTTASLKTLLAPNQGCCFTSNTEPSCRRVRDQQMPIHWLCTVGDGDCNKCTQS